MKHLFKSANLPTMAVGLGFAAQLLRRLLYAVAVDEKKLLALHHPVELVLWLLSAAVLLYLGLSVRKLDGSREYEDNFFPSKSSKGGHLAAAIGIALTVFTNEPGMSGTLGRLWLVFGYLSPLCLMGAGLLRQQGRKPFFLLHLIPALFLTLHIVNHYQVWCADPQLQDYLFTLLGTMALLFFLFYNACFDADMGWRRRQLFAGLAAVYLLIAELAASRYPWLYLGGILLALTDLCSLNPVPKKIEEPKEESNEGPHDPA